jgi:hypothetical protein
MRAFGALFIATSAATPLRAGLEAGRPVVRLTEVDSNRNYTFPNPETLDVPNLYRSHSDYLRASYDLVQRGVRFGNNNWTPVRARSFAEPVERLILTTSDQLHAIYHRGLYAAGESATAEAMAQQIERENLLARINIPMARVEVRTDEGGHPLAVDVANLALKELLLIQFYADPAFARAFRYDHEDVARARRNEAAASRLGLRAEIENPFTGKPVGVRDFLRWTLEQLRPLGEALDMWARLSPVVEMASGAPNTAERMRARIESELGAGAAAEPEVPASLLKTLAMEREADVARDVEYIAGEVNTLGEEAYKLRDLLQRARDDVRQDPAAPIRFRPRVGASIALSYPDKTSEVLDLARQLIHIPSVTNCADERLDEVHRAGTLIFDYLRDAGLEVEYFDRSKYPAVLAAFPGGLTAPVMLSGHFDVVQPEPDDSQFETRLEGDYLWGRGAADMKTVVATNMVWMKDALKAGPPYPAVNLCLVGNEENGEFEPMGTPHILAELAARHNAYAPQLMIAGERTGEKGTELLGEVCVENRGVMRFEVIARGARAHSALSGASADLGERLLQARTALVGLFEQHLTSAPPTAGNRSIASRSSTWVCPASTTSPPTTACSGSRSGPSRRIISARWSKKCKTSAPALAWRSASRSGRPASFATPTILTSANSCKPSPWRAMVCPLAWAASCLAPAPALLRAARASSGAKPASVRTPATSATSCLASSPTCGHSASLASA